MVKLTLGDARERLARVAGFSGFGETDARLVDRINDAVEDLMESADTPFVIDTLEVAADTNGIITLPNNIDRIVSAVVTKTPIHLRSAWYEYVDSGLGLLNEDDRTFIVLERGESPLFIDFPTDTAPYVLTIEAALDETTGSPAALPYVFIRGLDENGDNIRSTSVITGLQIDGIEVQLTGSGPFRTATTQQFSKVTSFIKPTTMGPINLYATTDPGGVDTQIGAYTAQDTTISLRRYFVPSEQDEDEVKVVTIRGKRRFVPVSHDNDELAIPSIQALKYMMISHHKLETQDEGGAASNFLLASQKMWELSIGYRGKTKTPSISVERGLGIGDFEPIR